MADIERDIVLRVKSETEQAQGQFKSLKQELRSIEQQLNQMAESGDTGSKAFKELQRRAGEVKDQIGDTKSAIKALSSDTFKLDAFSQAAQGIAGGFAAAQGAMALFGSENKQVEEAIKKTQGAMALLQGVTSITNILQKESALRLAIATTAQGAYTAVVGASTGAMKLFRLALASTGIGALVVGLGLLISNFDDVKKVVNNLLKPFDGIIAKVRDFLSTISFGLIDDSSTLKTKENAQQSMDAIVRLSKANESIEKQMQRNIDIAKAKGNNDKEVFKLEKELADFRLKNIYAEQDAIKRKIQAGNATDEERKRLLELVQTARDVIKEREILEINYNNGVKKRAEEKAEKEKKEKEEREKKEKEAKDKAEKEAQEAKEKAEKEAKEQREFEDKERQLALEADRKHLQDRLDSKRFNVEQEKAMLEEAYLSGIISETEYNEKVLAIEEEVAEQKKRLKEAEAKAEKELFEKRKATMMEWMQITMDGLNALSQLNEAFSRKDMDGQRKAFERDKKFKLASAITATAMGVAQQIAVPKDQLTGMNFAKAAIVLATGIAQIKKISDTKFEGGGSPPSNNIGPNVSLQPSSESTTTPGINSTMLNLDAQGNLRQNVSRTYVVESEISDKQRRSKQLSQTAILGK